MCNLKKESMREFPVTASGPNKMAIRLASKWGDSRFKAHSMKDVIPAHLLPR